MCKLEEIVNVNALRAALDSGMSAATILNWVDDKICEMKNFNEYYDSSYVAVSKKNYEEVKQRLNQLELMILRRYYEATI